MEYLLVMSFSGSTMMGLYFLLKTLLKDKASARLYYIILKAAVLFFLTPLSFLKGWYRAVIGFFIPMEQMKGVQIPIAWTEYVVHVGKRMYVNAYAVIQTTMVMIWLCVACILMVRSILKYVRIRRLILECEDAVMSQKQQSFLAELKKEYGVRRPVILCHRQETDPTMTFGVCRPVILCGKGIDNWRAEMHIRHEMVHIKRLDVLWKMLMRFVVILHWWNPVAWTLQRELERFVNIHAMK